MVHFYLLKLFSQCLLDDPLLHVLLTIESMAYVDAHSIESLLTHRQAFKYELLILMQIGKRLQRFFDLLRLRDKYTVLRVHNLMIGNIDNESLYVVTDIWLKDYDSP